MSPAKWSKRGDRAPAGVRQAHECFDRSEEQGSMREKCGWARGENGRARRDHQPRARRNRRPGRRDARRHHSGHRQQLVRRLLQRLDRPERSLLAAVRGADLGVAGSAFLAPEDLLTGVPAEEVRAGYRRGSQYRQQGAKGGKTAQHGLTITERRASCQFKTGSGMGNAPTSAPPPGSYSRYLPRSGASLRRASGGILVRSDQIASASADWQEHSPCAAATSGSARRMRPSAFSVAARR